MHRNYRVFCAICNIFCVTFICLTLTVLHQQTCKPWVRSNSLTIVSANNNWICSSLFIYFYHYLCSSFHSWAEFIVLHFCCQTCANYACSLAWAAQTLRNKCFSNSAWWYLGSLPPPRPAPSVAAPWNCPLPCDGSAAHWSKWMQAGKTVAPSYAHLK